MTYHISRLRILHISHDSLPDWRVEKSALTSVPDGHQISFAGAKVSDRLTTAESSQKYMKSIGLQKLGMVSLFIGGLLKKPLKKSYSMQNQT